MNKKSMPDNTQVSFNQKRGKKRTRTRDIGVTFSNGLATGWAFGVPEAFRDAMDIRFLKYKDGDSWTIGEPPARSFAVGHIFYEPPGCRAKKWRDALKVLRRAVQVKEAVPDQIKEAVAEQDRVSEGWVRFEVLHFRAGKIVRTEERKLSQKEFLRFLESGTLPDAGPFISYIGREGD